MTMNHVRYEEGIAWCGRPLDHNFHFKDIEQLTINNLHGERLVCEYCLRNVIRVLIIVPEVVELTSDTL